MNVIGTMTAVNIAKRPTKDEGDLLFSFATAWTSDESPAGGVLCASWDGVEVFIGQRDGNS